MKQILIIPDRAQIETQKELAEQFGLGFEYNDFYVPAVLDDEQKLTEIVGDYKKQKLPVYTTSHGAFFDVIPFSPDARIREISALRIEQSIEAARRVGADAVVFHTAYNPSLRSEKYVSSWLETNTVFWSGVLEKHPDIKIYLENTFEATPDILERLSENLSDYANYGVCLDYAHAFLTGTAPEIWAQKLGRFVKHIHINDNDGYSDLHWAWGDGVVDRNDFYKCYEKYMEGATVLVEVTSLEKQIKSLEILQKDGFLGI